MYAYVTYIMVCHVTFTYVLTITEYDIQILLDINLSIFIIY